jgi:hypothetical protein
VDDNLLPLERGILVRDDADLPAGRVRLAPFGERERLGRRLVFAPLAERAALPFPGRLRLELEAALSARSLRASRSNRDESSGERVAP